MLTTDAGRYGVQGGAASFRIDSKADTPRDRSADLEELKATSLIEQRNTLIKAMVKVFSWLNGGVFVLTAVAWGFGFYFQHDQIVTEKVLMALIGATVVQAGIAFVAITRFLFPSSDRADDGASTPGRGRRTRRREQPKADLAP